MIIALATGEAYQRTGSEYVRYEGAGPGYDSTRVVVGGWPLPFLLDKPYLSVVGSVSVVGGLLREDTLRAGPLLADVLIVWAALLALWRGTLLLRRVGRFR